MLQWCPWLHQSPDGWLSFLSFNCQPHNITLILSHIHLYANGQAQHCLSPLKCWSDLFLIPGCLYSHLQWVCMFICTMTYTGSSYCLLSLQYLPYTNLRGHHRRLEGRQSGEPQDSTCTRSSPQHSACLPLPSSKKIKPLQPHWSLLWKKAKC